MFICLFLTPACDDECTGVLLDDLEKIHNHFLSVNLSSIAVAPYRQLVLLENQTKDIQVDTHQCANETSCAVSFHRNVFLLMDPGN